MTESRSRHCPAGGILHNAHTRTSSENAASSSYALHAYDTSIEGWLVLVARRHITAVADMTDAEAAELGPLVKDVSAALGVAVGCVKTYVVQFAEHSLHPHVHVHVIPRLADQPEDMKGPRIFDCLGVPEDLGA